MLRIGVALVLGAAFALIAHRWSASYDARLAESGGFAHRENRFAVQQSSTTGASVLGFLLIGGLGVVCALASRAGSLRCFNPLALLLTAYLFWCAASFLWSDYPGLSVRKLAILALMIAGAYGVAIRCSLNDILWVVILLVAGELCIGFAAEIANGMFRPWRSDYRFTGTLDPNGIGLEAAALALAAWLAPFEKKDRPYLRAALVTLGVAIVMLSKSRTSLAALVAAGLVAFLLRARGQQRWLIISGTICLACIVGIALSFVSVGALQKSTDVAAMGRQQNVSTLTGRLPLWEALMQEAQRSPWVGFGYGAFWTPDHILRYSDAFLWHIPHAHNTYLDLVLATGLVGLTLYLAWMLALAVTAWLRYDQAGNPADLFVCSFVALCLMHGLAESKIPGAGLTTLLLYACVASLALKPAVANAATTVEPAPKRAPLAWTPIRRMSL